MIISTKHWENMVISTICPFCSNPRERRFSISHKEPDQRKQRDPFIWASSYVKQRNWRPIKRVHGLLPSLWSNLWPKFISVSCCWPFNNFPPPSFYPPLFLVFWFLSVSSGDFFFTTSMPFFNYSLSAGPFCWTLPILVTPSPAQAFPPTHHVA